MNKKLVALAVATAFSAPAFADNANITMYGKAFLTIDSASNNKSTTALRVNTNASRFGIKGDEDLGDGLKGFYQFEVQMDADGSGGNGMGNGTRNSGAGVEGEFGKVLLGIWDTPYKLAHNPIELFDNTTAWTTTKTIGRTANAKDFNTRQKNQAIYWSPKLGGLQVAAAYGANETTNARNYLSLSGAYEMDDLYAAVAYESRPDQTTATVTDSGLRVVAKYKMGDIWVGGTYENLKVNTSTTASYTQGNLELAGQYKLGTSNIGAAYVKTGKSSAANTGASQLSLRYGYTFSKRTELFAAYASVKNESAVKYALGAGTATNGATETVIGAGVIHSF